MNANVPPGLSQRRTIAEEVVEPVARDVAQPEAGEHGVDLPIGLGPRVAHVEVRPQPVRDEALAGALERRRRPVVERQLALRGEERRPPAGPRRELDDLAADRAARRASDPPRRARRSRRRRGSGRARSGRDAGTSRRTRAPGPRSRRACRRRRRRRRPAGSAARRRLGLAGRGLGHGRAPRSAGGSALGQRLAQPEAEEAVVTGLADAVRAELRPALEVVRAAARVGRPAPQAVERRAEGHRLASPLRPRPASTTRTARCRRTRPGRRSRPAARCRR